MSTVGRACGGLCVLFLLLRLCVLSVSLLWVVFVVDFTVVVGKGKNYGM